MAKLPSGSWRTQVRRTGRVVSEPFMRRDDVLCWSCLAELSVGRNETQVSSRIGGLKAGLQVRGFKPRVSGQPQDRWKAAQSA